MIENGVYPWDLLSKMADRSMEGYFGPLILVGQARELVFNSHDTTLGVR